MKIKKINFTLLSCFLVVICSFTYFLYSFLNLKQSYNGQRISRTIELKENYIDYQNILNEFEDSVVKKDGNVTNFTAYQLLNLNDLEEVNNTNCNDLYTDEIISIEYYLSYDSEKNIITISAEMKNSIGEIEIDNLHGVAFINEKNQIDAVINLDGESVLLSEMQEAGMIANCGWFKKMVKKVVKVAVVATTVAAVAFATAAVVVATAGVVAPALVAAGVGITTSASIGTAAGIGMGALFFATIGQSAIQAGTAISEPIANGVSQVVDKCTNAIIAIIIQGIEYSTILLTSATVYSIDKNNYHLAVISNDNCVYISKLPIDRILATWATRMNMAIYTFYNENAYQIAKDAGEGNAPIWNSAHIYKGETSNLKAGIFFNHWHTYNHLGHCLYGSPYINW